MVKAEIKKSSWVAWSEDEVKLLKRLYPSENTQSIADKLGWSSEWIRHKANLIGLKKVGRATIWSKQELTLLKKLYPDSSIPDIANQIGQTVLAVTGRAHKLGLIPSAIKKCAL